MDLLEADGKKLFARYDLPLPAATLVTNAAQATKAARPYKKIVLKVQIPTGHRGKTGGIVIVNSIQAADAAAKLLGSVQQGYKVTSLLAEEFVALSHEWFFSLTVDRLRREIVTLFSMQGGIDIESLADSKELVRLVAPDQKVFSKQLRKALHGKEVAPETVAQLETIAKVLLRLLQEQDASVVEVNPLGVTTQGALTLIDSKVSIDDNALFRHPEYAKLKKAGTALETRAQQEGLAFVPLKGTIAVIGNGAGLVMATLDILAHFGGEAANFLDVGGGAQADRMEKALEIVLSQKSIEGIFINIFGGITRTDEIARGILAYKKSKGITIPMVVRLIGNRDHIARALLEKEGIKAFTEMDQAAQEVIRLSQKKKNS
jgi:succinyl-CoA synthetase beta subunit